ncbi:RNA polymerase sigma factor [Ectopseudomonas khazarica]|uniref:RNA polymerase sigma factor n=1 Tax=Ectopseudomonas khazarica TaxID=2502979 RepID=UPI0037C9A8EC
MNCSARHDPGDVRAIGFMLVITILDCVYAGGPFQRSGMRRAFENLAILMRRRAPSSLLHSFQTHYEDLLRFLSRRLGDSQRAADVAQDTWLRLADHPDEQRVENPRAYLFRVAGNLAIDNLRRDNRLAELHVEEDVLDELSDPLAAPEKHLLARESLVQLDAALAQLPAKAREALLLNRLDGLTHAQIARRLGVSESMVGKYLAQAMRHCRQWRSQQGGER